MDVDRFAAELPALFDDFPRSEHPSGRRFDDIVEAVPNLARENNLALVNLAASLLDPGESYVEAGSFHGASLIAAARDNDGDFVGIDDFSMTGGALGRPGTSRGALIANLVRFGAEKAAIVEGDALEVLRDGRLGDRRIGVFYYDAAHSYEAHLEALRGVEPYLAPSALLIVDDSDWEQVGSAIQDYLAQQPKAALLLEVKGKSHGQPQWWEGVTALAWRDDG